MATESSKTGTPERSSTVNLHPSDATRVDGKEVSQQDSSARPPVTSVFNPGLRYEIRRLLGKGGYAHVYAAFDRDLRREVALKVVKPPPGVERDLFIREARVTAGLVHPNIPTVYDVAEKDGTFFLSMDRVSGQSLGSLIRAAATRGDAEVLPQTELLEIMLKVADALAYAHANGVVHRDVKPDNIVIGSYGKVVVIDWGAAHFAHDEFANESLVIGTPAYMAPEQFNSDVPTPASDIYGLGATLFHALLLRAPIARSETKDFLRRKARGSIDPPTKTELARTPRALLGIALKAMSALQRDRYASMNALGQALRDVLVGRKAWLAPLTEDLTDDNYQERWTSVPANAFKRDGERLVSTDQAGCLLIYKQRLAAGVALEFDGEILQGERPGDLSVFWTDDDVLEPVPHWPVRNTISLQVAAYDNLNAGIYRDFWRCLDGRSLSIEVGKTYQIRAEVDEQNFRLYLDGELIAQYEQLFSTPSGHIGIYSYSPGKSFSNIRLFERSVPERISPTAVGDAFYVAEDYAAAAVHYGRVEQRLPATELAEEVRFKRGLCELQNGQYSLAKELWSTLHADVWRTRASLHMVDEEFRAGNHAAVVEELDKLFIHTPSARALIVDRWVQYVSSLCDSNAAPLEQYAVVRDRHFPDDPGSAATAAQLEYERGNYRVVVERYPEQHPQHFEALCALGEFARASDCYRAVPWMNELSLLQLNQFDCIHNKDFLALVHTLRGDPQGALAVGQCAEAMLCARKFDDVIQYRFAKHPDYAAALRGQGRVAEAAARGDGRALCQLDVGEEALNSPLRLEERLYVLQHLVLRSFIRGEMHEYRRHWAAAATTPCAAIWTDVWLPRHFLFPILECETGDTRAFERSATHVIGELSLHWNAKAYYLARFILGQIELAEFETQPVCLYMRARSLLARALKAEYVSDEAAAANHYREYLELPDEERFSDSPRGDPLVEHWVAYRIERLRHR